MLTLSPEKIAERLSVLHQASLELIRETSLKKLLHRIATIACDQVNARYAAVGVLSEDGAFEQFIPIGFTPEKKYKMQPPEGKGLLGVLMHSHESIRIVNIQLDPRSAGLPLHHPEMTSFLGVPIQHGNQILGQIYLTNKIDANEFNADDQQVIEILAAYAAAAISNARLYTRLTSRNENLALLNQLASSMVSLSDIDQILNKTLTQVMDYLHLDIGEVYLSQEEEKPLKLVLHRGDSVSWLWKSEVFQYGKGLIGQVGRSGKPRLMPVQDINDLDFNHQEVEKLFDKLACFPLTGRNGVLGVICTARKDPANFDEAEIQFVTAIGSWVGTIIENLRLSIQQRRLAVLEERERIGMDLHDGVIQSIYAVGLILDNSRHLILEDTDRAQEVIDKAIDNLNNTIRDIRAYILDLRPRKLQDENLLQGAQRLVSEFRVNTLVDVSLKGSFDELKDLPNQQAVALFHICQEALANIAKHARAKKVDVNFWTAGERALLEVRDDGRGFNPSATRMALGHGLSNMQTRAHSSGGDLDIISEPGGGTTILAWVPFVRNQS